MKRKIFSKLLMGAFLIASVSMFVSCKDYDDDISKVNADVAALKTSLDSQIKTLTDALNQAKTDAATAHATFATKVELANAQSALEDASEANATAIKANVEAINALKEAVAASATVAQMEQAVAELKALAEAQINEEELAAALAVLSAQIDAINEDLNTLKTDVPALKAWKETVDASVLAVTADLTTQKAAIDALQAAMTGKADAATVEAIVAQLATKADASAVEAAVKALGDKADASAVQTALAGKADASAIATLTEAIKKLNTDIAGKLDKGSIAGLANEEAVKAYIAEQLKAYAKAGVVDASTTAAINNALKSYKTADELTKILGDYATKTNITETLKAYYTATQLDKQAEDAKKYIDDQIKAVKDAAITEAQIKTIANNASAAVEKSLGEKINNLNVYVNKKLSSIVLQPEFYWEGLEAIEAGFISQTPVFVPVQKDYKFSYKVTDATLGVDQINVTVKEVMTSALAKAVGGKSYVVLEGCTGETINNGAAAIAEVWPTAGEKSLKIADIDAAVAAAVPTAQAKKIDIKKATEAYYHINPRSADIEGAQLAFFENDAEVYTRGNYASTGKIGATPVEATYKSDSKVNIKKDGVLKVPFNFNGNAVLSMFNSWTKGVTTDPTWDIDDDPAFGTAKQLPFIGLQIESKDTTVTSDYAVVVPAVYTIVALADSLPEEILDENTFVGWDKHAGKIRANHLYESVGYNTAKDHSDGTSINLGAIPMPATHSVQYDSLINLKPFIQTHYNYTTYTKYGTSTVDKLMTPAQMKAFGLHYEFTKVTYITDKNVTDQTAHIEQVDANGNPTTDKKSGYFAPRSVTADGAMISGKKATREAIDREPLIRVDLIDEATNSIVRYGYIKLRIVEKKEELKDKSFTIEFPEQYMDCGTEVRVTWSQMENLILSKLGTNGLTKKEFEEQYYMEAENGETNMPTETVAPIGTLYDQAADNKWWAVRYYKTSANKFALAVGKKTEAEAWTAGGFDSKNLENNWFGRVWYTPHDNSTNAHAWDENTNVIVWNLFGEKPGNMNKARWEQLRDVIGATFENHGTSQKDLATTLRFINKANKTSVYVTLKIPAKKLFFQWASVSNKDWSHWWAINTQKGGVTGSKDYTTVNKSIKLPYGEEFDVHANTPVPAANAYDFLSVESFEQDLKDYWKEQAAKMIVLGDVKNFKKFNDLEISFHFVTPAEGTNSENTTASKGQWKVTGITGTVWTLELRDHKDITKAGTTAIVAVKKQAPGKAAVDYLEEICYLANSGETIPGGSTIDNDIIHYNGLADVANAAKTYPAATDLLNKSGRYDKFGAPRYEKASGADATLGYLNSVSYLNKDIDESFTAYIKILAVHDGCYDPLIGKNLFNVRFLRPINVAPREVEWKDIPNVMQKVNLTELIDIIDYRDIPVVGKADAARQQVFYYGSTKFNAPKYADVTDGAKVKVQNAGVPYEFYGIKDLAVIYDEIRTDHDVESATVRGGAYKTDEAEIKKLTKVIDLSSMSSILAGGNRVLSLYNEGATTCKNPGDKYSTGLGRLEYTNNSGIVQRFHIYVPIAVHYNWGNIKDDVLHTGGKLDQNYTQTVWAVITVKPSY